MVGNDKGSRGLPAKAHIPDFTGLLCEHAPDGTLRIVKRQAVAG